MELIPAIDILNGKTVRLYQGQFEQSKEYSDAPLDLIQNMNLKSDMRLHIVDLNGARDPRDRQLDLLKKICSLSGLKIQVGGGLRSLQDCKALLETGISKVVLGSLAIAEPDLVLEWIDQLGPEQVVLALDVKSVDGEYTLFSNGWKKNSGKTLWTLLDIYQDMTGLEILCTDIQKDGAMQGPSTKLYQEFLGRYPNFQLIASGGVSSYQNLSELRSLGCSGVVIGKALYEGQLNLKEAYQCLQKESSPAWM